MMIAVAAQQRVTFLVDTIFTSKWGADRRLVFGKIQNENHQAVSFPVRHPVWLDRSISCPSAREGHCVDKRRFSLEHVIEDCVSEVIVQE
jgi:hypothetical protein